MQEEDVEGRTLSPKTAKHRMEQSVTRLSIRALPPADSSDPITTMPYAGGRGAVGTAGPPTTVTGWDKDR